MRLGPLPRMMTFLRSVGRGLVFFFVGGVEIGRVALEFGGAGVHAFVHGLDAVLAAKLMHFFRRCLVAVEPGGSQAHVGEAHALQFVQALGIDFTRAQLHLLFGNFLELVEKPGIDVGHERDLAHAHALRQRVADVHQSIGIRRHQLLGDDARLDIFHASALPCLQRPDTLEQRLLEGTADGHNFADRLHLRAERLVHAGKLLELPLGDLDDHVVERRLEAGGRLARNVVGDFVERVADGKLGRNFGDGESGRLRCQRRGARHAWVHLNDNHSTVSRIDRELNVRAAGLDADLADDLDSSIAHGLVFAVGERLRGRDRDRIAGVHAHGIEVFDGADDDDVVGEVSHHLQLIFLPAEHRLFQQHFMHGRKVEAARQ